MRRLPWAALALIAGTACANLVFVGCGSESNPDVPADGGGDENTVTPPPPPNPDQDTGIPEDGGFLDAIVDGGRDPDAMVQCTVKGSSCATSAECCTSNCAVQGDGGKACADPITLCKQPGTACALGNECCTGSCTGGSCSNILCAADGLSCGNANDCCSQNCVPDGTGGGVCKTLSPTGKPTSGNPCTSNGDCATGWCNNGVCANPSFCTVNGDICSTDVQCCGGSCVKAAGASVGYCGTAAASGTPNCVTAGNSCGLGADAGAADAGGTLCDQACCSRSCGPYITGAFVCEPASGCKPTGEICANTNDCCGGPQGKVTCSKAAGAAFGRCTNNTGCTPPGGTCKTGDVTSCSVANNCCEPVYADGGAVGNSYCNNAPGNCCRQDALGIPRCLQIASDCTANPPPPGTACSTSADCCNLPCVNGACGSTCVGTGGACTSTSDCCPGLPCAIPPGATTGICGGTVLQDGGVSDASLPGTDGGVITQDAGYDGGDGGGSTVVCSLYGQMCDSTHPCCNNVPCDVGGTNTCHFN